MINVFRDHYISTVVLKLQFYWSNSQLHLFVIVAYYKRKLYNVAHLSSFCSWQVMMDENSFSEENYTGFFSLPVSCGWKRKRTQSRRHEAMQKLLFQDLFELNRII